MIYTFFASGGTVFPITALPIPPGGDLIDPGIETKTDLLMLEVSFWPCHHYVIYSAHLLIFFFVFLILSINCKYFY